MLKKELVVEVKNPKQVLEAIEPDMDGTKRFRVELVPEEKKIRIKVEATDEAAMRAAESSYLRLIHLIKTLEV